MSIQPGFPCTVWGDFLIQSVLTAFPPQRIKILSAFEVYIPPELISVCNFDRQTSDPGIAMENQGHLDRGT
jgi:hypothetical protein